MHTKHTSTANMIVDDCSSITDTHAIREVNDSSGGIDGASEFTPEKAIYGRTTERLALLKAYQRLLQTKHAQTVIVHGKSGSGKTALVNALRTQLVDAQTPGYFVAGKYFQNEGGVQEAHSAIVAAFSDLCDLVAQSDDFDEVRQQQVKEDLGSDAELLIKSISNLATLVVGNVSDGGDTVQEDKASVGKFKIACKTFLRAMACNSHPVVIFLDDIQWADEGSIQLIEMFLQDCALKNVMFILAYRDDQAAKVECMLTHARSPVDIELSNLDDDAVYSMVSAITGLSSESVRDLSKLVSKRTSGNPFHVVLFMETIEREGLIVFDNSNGACNFDVAAIQMGIMANESSADLLARKIELLSKDIIEILKVASLLGYHFREAILITVSSTIQETKVLKGNQEANRDTPHFTRNAVLAALADAVEEEFIEMSPNGYQFTHDKLQAAFRALIDDQEKDRLHLLIGQVFLAHAESDQALMYKSAVHLNCAPGFMFDMQQRVSLAKINLEAALYCEQKSSFFQAVAMLRKGLSAIDSHEPWSEATFDLTFQMMESLARTQLIIGDFEGCKETAMIALNHGKTVEMKVNLLLIDVEVRMAENEIEGSLAAAFRALRTLGVRMPKKVAFHHVVGKFLKVKRMLRGKTDDDLLQLPINHELLTTSAVKLLMHVCAYCLVKDEVNAGIYSALLGTEITVKTGLSPHSSSAFVFYGVAEASLGNIDRAFQYGKLALTMLENMPSKEAECCTVGFALTMLTFWKEPSRLFVDPLHRVANAGYQRGDVLYATYSLAQSFHVHLHLGTNLAELEASLRKSYDMVSDLSQDGMILWFRPALQYVINMQSERTNWENISDMSGEVMNEEEYFGQVREAGNLALNMICSLMKAEIASYFGQFASAARIYDEIRSCKEDAVRLSFGACMYYWNAARTYYSLYEESGKWRYLRKGLRHHRLLKQMEAAGCPNAIPLVAFLDTQRLAQRKHIGVDELRACYDRGIQTFGEHRFCLIEGILNEKAGFDFAAEGMLELATHYFERALYLYHSKVGATAKYNWLVRNSEISLVRMYNTNTLGLPRRVITIAPDQEVPPVDSFICST